METKDGIPAFHAKSNEEWRQWLSENGSSEKSVWLIMYHKNSGIESIQYNESIEEALCFGWIDSKANKRDEHSSYLFFTPRKAKSKWSKINKQRIEKMVARGLMTPAGQALIDLAKKTGTWDALTDADNAIIPEDLQAAFEKNKIARDNFEKFTASVKRLTLEWIMDAKRPETRIQRVTKTIDMAERNQKVR